jgi:hypothetical protein
MIKPTYEEQAAWGKRQRVTHVHICPVHGRLPHYAEQCKDPLEMFCYRCVATRYDRRKPDGQPKIHG